MDQTLAAAYQEALNRKALARKEALKQKAIARKEALIKKAIARKEALIKKALAKKKVKKGAAKKVVSKEAAAKAAAAKEAATKEAAAKAAAAKEATAKAAAAKAAAAKAAAAKAAAAKAAAAKAAAAKAAAAKEAAAKEATAKAAAAKVTEAKEAAAKAVKKLELVPISFKVPHPKYLSKLIVPDMAMNTEISKVRKVLHLPTNPASQMSTQAIALRKLGVPASYCNYSSKNRYGYPTDLASPFKGIPQSEQDTAMMRYAIESANKYDIFHFHSGQTFTFTSYAYTDLPYLSLFNKKMVMTYWGSEIRRLSLARQNNPYARARILDEKKILERLHVISRYMDAVIAPDHEMFEYLEGYFKKVYLVRQAVDYRKFEPVYPQATKRPLVVHAPSNPFIKGTEYIVRAVERLKKSVNFDYIQVENMPHAEAVKLYKKADIIIDQLCLGIYSIFSIEGMLLGKPVITYIRDDLRKTYPKDLPIVSANPATIEGTLHDLLLNPDKRRNLGMLGRSYALNYHDPNKIARQLITVYNNI